MSTRKRRRQEAFKEDEPSKPPSLTEEEKEKLREEKEQEIWESIREVHYEAIEQLPLTLQRQLSLMRQLDEQTTSTGSRLLPMLQKYIELRRRMERKEPPNEQPDELVVPQPQEQAPTAEDNRADTSTHLNSEPPVATPVDKLRTQESRSVTRNTTPSVVPSDHSKDESSRDVIRQVAFMAEELLRASQEKVNLAQTNYDSVERHIHLLDRAIEEQEAAISADPSKSIHIHLPELIIPQYNRNTRKDKLVEDELDEELEEQFTPTTAEELTTNKKRASKKKGKEGSNTGQIDGNGSTPLTITLPAQSNEEPAYCYCQRVSFGEMIACDNAECEREWFHLGCVGLTEPPEGEWFCEDCNSDES